MKKGELEADTDKVMPEYRAQLDAERALKLSNGRDYSSDKFRNGDSSTSFGLTRGGVLLSRTKIPRYGVAYCGRERNVVAVDIVHLTSYAISLSCFSRLNAFLLGNKVTS
ncbi:hypothetical protein Bca52824_007199 [Brassica carinata]|uniref:Uncharacterized protein n=1 Tax=Brassica carinata TaxID=52824 RepID=A0A8X7W6L8_BRACI|nr:hypothetical protein Bca52824_007199 [Brassica carinata]